MTECGKISGWQLFSVLLLCSLGGELVFPFLGGYSGEELLAVVIAAALRFVVAFPIIIYSFCRGSMYRDICGKSRILGWLAALVAATMLIGYAALTLANAAEYVQRNMLTHHSEWLLIALLAAFALYCAMSGAEGFSRAAVMILVLLLLLTVIVVLTDIPHMQWDRAAPSESSGGLLNSVIKRLLSGGEYLAFAALLPHVSRNSDKHSPLAAGKAALFYALCGTLIGVGQYVFYSAVLGELYTLTEYPFTAAAQLADAVIIKRMDGIACAVAALCAAIKCGVFGYCAVSVFREIIGVRATKKEAAE